MLKELRLTNFCQHEELAVSFTEGLNIIRGSNEAGKSTLFVSIAYAFYGARALPLALEDTVTWGKPVSSLKVELNFSHAGQAYSLIRKKSGASLAGPDGLLVSGHSEVTLYVERLFSASCAVAVSTMIAGQGQLKESLDGSSVSLIEQLSNMSLIDELVDSIQKHLPSGNFTVFETQLESLAELVEPVADFTTLSSSVESCSAAEYAAADAADEAKSEYELAKAEADAAAGRVSEARAYELKMQLLSRQIEQARALFATVAPTCSEALTVEQLTTAKNLQSQQELVKAKYALFATLPMTGARHNREVAALEVAEAGKSLKVAQSVVRKAELDRATAKAGIITQSACGLCGKDLTDVPEVVRVNSAAEAEVAALSGLIEVQSVLRRAHENTCAAGQALLNLDQRQGVKLGQLVGYVDVDNTTIPCGVAWSGPAMQHPADTANYDTRLYLLRMYLSDLAVHAAQVKQAAESLANLQKEVSALPVLAVNQLDRLAAAVAAARLRDAQAATASCSAAKQATAAANFALASATQAHNFALERYTAGLAKRGELATTIAAYRKHNQLVKKLREARPVVAKRLWGSVLLAVSTYFSAIRGTNSTVTRSDTKFLVDGKPIAAYSGSTKDALGLAIRVTLQKTFLGSLDFMLADEVASAADPVRETAMLGMLSTCGYGQVILVTHSDLADSFASNIIRI